MNIVMLVLGFIASAIISIPLACVLVDSVNDLAQLATAVSFANTVLLIAGINMAVKRLDVIIKDIKHIKEKDKKEAKAKDEAE